MGGAGAGNAVRAGSARADPQQISNFSHTTATGMPREMPSALLSLALTTPTTSPCALTTGPPELPGLTGASNWSTGPSAVLRSALTTPLVTESSRPSGDPITTTGRPAL